jgi:YggT family protein
MVRVIVQVTEPIMAPVRKMLPPMGGFDLSPLIVLLGVQLLQILFKLH